MAGSHAADENKSHGSIDKLGLDHWSVSEEIIEEGDDAEFLLESRQKITKISLDSKKPVCKKPIKKRDYEYRAFKE